MVEFIVQKMQPLSNDRNLFIKKITANPSTLSSNIGSLAHKIYLVISNRIKLKLKSKHCGLKQKPPWIASNKVFDHSLNSTRPSYFCLPAYPAIHKAELPNLQIRPKNLQDDPEGYLNENRWAFLAESLPVDFSSIYANQIRVLDWMQSHADKDDDAWETYSACERVSNLLVYLSVIGSHPMLPEFENKAIDFVVDSVGWIYQHMEYYGSDATNNHILNNARALVVGGAAVGNEAFCRAGLNIFRECLPNMVGEHGFLRERSTHYQLIVSNWVLDAWRFAEGYYGADHLDSIFLFNYGQRMINAAGFICNTHGHLLGLVGDISPDASPLHSTLRLSGLYPEYWPITNVDYPAMVLKDGWFRITGANQIVLGNFPTGIFPPKFPTHGHNDYTGFIWIKDGVEILADIGRYRYTPDAVSLLQKSALGHCVLLVDGFPPLCDSLIKNGQWCPQPYATANLISWASNGTVYLSHDGFARATNVLRHTRAITLNETGLVVVDSLEGSGDAVIRLHWNFGESFDVFDSTLMIVKGSDSVVKFTTKSLPESPLADSASVQLCDSWISTAYGEAAPSIAVDVSGSVKLPVVISTCFEIIKCAE